MDPLVSTIRSLEARATALATVVDAAYERDDPAAEDLDAQLALLEFDLWSRAEAWEEEGGDINDCEGGDAGNEDEETAGVEESIVAAWILYNTRYREGSAADLAHHVRSILISACGSPTSYRPSEFRDPGDAALVRLARDLQAEELRRRAQRRRPAPHQPSVASRRTPRAA